MVFYCLSPFSCVIRLSSYLNGVYSVEYDVMKIYHTPTFTSINDSEEELDKYCVWNRDDDSVKNHEKVELTLAEIAAKFDIAIESLVIKKWLTLLNGNPLVVSVFLCIFAVSKLKSITIMDRTDLIVTINGK